MLCFEKYYAPNGKESVLYNDLLKMYSPKEAERIYLHTFTDEFKAKFGDWETVANMRYKQERMGALTEEELKITQKALSNMSRAVDENGQPKIVFHGTHHNIKPGEFSKETHFGSFEAAMNRKFNVVTDLKEKNLDRAGYIDENWKVYPAFLNVKAIKRTPDVGDVFWNREITNAREENYDSLVYDNRTEGDTSYLVLNPASIMTPMTVRAQKPSSSPEQVKTNLVTSNERVKLHDKLPNGKIHQYVLDGDEANPLTSVSRVIDDVVKYEGTPAGEEYSDAGKRYHLIVENLIKGDTITTIDAQLNLEDFEIAYAKQAWVFINNLKNKGGYLVSELKMADVEKNIAGTADIIHIKEDGTVDLYDMKTANKTPALRKRMDAGQHGPNIWDIHEDKSYKARRYSHQLAMYKEMLERGDAATGRKALSVDKVYVVPITIDRDPNNNIIEVKLLQSEDVSDPDGPWTSRGNFFDNAQGYVKNEVFGTNYSVPLEFNSDMDEVAAFVENILPDDKQERIERRARNIVNDNQKQEKVVINGKEHSWISANKEARVSQVVDLLNSKTKRIEEFVESLSRDFASNDKQTIRQLAKEGQDNLAEQISKIVNQVDTKNIFPLSQVEGFEKFRSVLMIEKIDGSFSLVEFTNEMLGQRIKTDYEKSNTLIGKAAQAINKAKKVTKKVGAINDTSSILSNLINDYEASTAGITLKNTVGDKMRLKLGLVATMIQNKNPDFRVSDFGIVTLNRRSNSLANTTSDMVNQIYKVMTHDSVKNVVPASLKKALEETPLVPADNDNRLLKYLTSLPASRFQDINSDRPNSRFYIKNILEKLNQDDIQEHEAVNELLNSERGLFNLIRNEARERGESINDVESFVLANKEYQLYTMTVLQLMDENITFDKDLGQGFMSVIYKFIVSPTITGRKNLDAANDFIRKHYDNIKRRGLEFNAKKNPLFKKLMNERSYLQKVTGKVTGMGQEVFESMLETREDPKTGKRFYTGYILTEERNKAEYDKLTDLEKLIADFISDNIKSYYEDAVNKKGMSDEQKKTWPRGFIPVMRKSSNTILYDMKKAAEKMDPKKVGKYMKKATVRGFETMSSYGLMKDGVEEGADKGRSRQAVEDYFKHQINNDGGVSSRTLERIGLDESGNLLEGDEALLANNDFETDLEEILNQMVLWSLKKQEMDKALPGYRLFKAVFTAQEQLYNNNQFDTKRVLDNFIGDLLYNEKIGDDNFLTKFISTSVSISSIMLLGLNIRVISANLVQATMNNFIDSVANSMSGNKRFPGVKSWKEAGKILMQASVDSKLATKLDLIMQAYMPEDVNQIFDQNVSIPTRSQVLSGKQSQQGLLNPRMTFILDRAIDYGTRMHAMVAQMLVDGTWDAHDIKSEEVTVRVNGKNSFLKEWKLVYDEKKDKRDKKLLNAIKNELYKKGELDANEDNLPLDQRRMTLAYDWNLRQKYKTYADRITGSFDKDKKSDALRFPLLAAFSQFRTWYREKLQRSIQPEYANKMVGDYTMDPDGEYSWKEGVMKGMYHTLADIGYIGSKFADDLKEKGVKEAWEDIPQVDKDNLTYALNSAAAWALLSLAAAGIAQSIDDKEDEELTWTLLFLNDLVARAITDAASTFSGEPLLSAGFDNPIVFLSYFERLFGTIKRTITYSFDGEFEKAFDQITRILPIVKDIKMK